MWAYFLRDTGMNESGTFLKLGESLESWSNALLSLSFQILDITFNLPF